METVDDLMDMLEAFKASVEDARMKNAIEQLKEGDESNVQFFSIIEGAFQLLKSNSKRLEEHDYLLASLKKKLKKIGKRGGSDDYTGPHPLNAVKIPTKKQQERIQMLSDRSRINTSPLRRDPENLEGMDPVKPAPPADKPNFDVEAGPFEVPSRDKK